MANSHPKEQSLYDQIEREKIKVPIHIWDMMYRYIGDDITAISQIALSYCKYGDPIEVDDGKKILEHTRKINDVVDIILRRKKIEAQTLSKEFPFLTTDGPRLHPVVIELFTHYIGNDVYGINMIVGFYLDPSNENPIPVEMAQKILDRTHSMKQFMDRLSAATSQEIRITRSKTSHHPEFSSGKTRLPKN